MGSLSLVHWIIFGVIAVLVLGGGRFSSLMGDVAKGIKQFKRGMGDDETPMASIGTPDAINGARAQHPDGGTRRN